MMRLILTRHVEPADRARILTDLGLELYNSQEDPGQAYFEVWMSLDLDDRAVIHYMDDIPSGVRYFAVKGDQRWVLRIRQSFSIMTDEAVFRKSVHSLSAPCRASIFA